MARPVKHDGRVFKRSGSSIWWIEYRSQSGQRRRESTQTEDWDEAQRKLRERLTARDDRTLEVVRKGEQMSFQDWVAFFLENYSKPPIRAAKTHEANMRALGHLQRAFGKCRLTELSADGIELYLRGRLKQRARVKLRSGFKEHSEASDGASRASSASANAERGSPEEIASGQSLRGRRVPGFDQRSVPAALCDMVGSTTDRIPCS